MERSRDPAGLVKAGIFTENPLLIEVTGLAPVLAGVSTVYAGVLVAAVSAVQLMLISWLTAVFLKKLPAAVRALCYFLIAVPVTAAAMWCGDLFLPEEAAEIGLFLPLTAASSLTALHCERHVVSANRTDGALHAFSASLGYTFGVLLISGVREIAVYGTLAGLTLPAPPASAAAKLPFFGLLLMGFLAAAINGAFKNELLFGGAEKNFMAHSVLQHYRHTETGTAASAAEAGPEEAICER